MAIRRPPPEIAKALRGPDLGYQQCEWLSNVRCRYPVWGATVVEASQDYRHIIPGSPEDLARATRIAQESLEAQGMSRQPNESFEAYRKRSMRYVREKMAGINKAKEAA